MMHVEPELLITGALVGLLVGISGLGWIVRRAAIAAVALAALWIVLVGGPDALVEHVDFLLETARQYADLLLGIAGGLVVAVSIRREPKRPER